LESLPRSDVWHRSRYTGRALLVPSMRPGACSCHTMCSPCTRMGYRKCDPGRSWRASHAPMFGIDPDTLVAHYWSPACARAPVAVIQCVLHAIEWVIECVFISHHRVSHPHLAARRPHAQAPVAAGSLAAKLTWECVRVCAARTDGSGECGVFCSRGFGGSCCMV